LGWDSYLSAQSRIGIDQKLNPKLDLALRHGVPIGIIQAPDQIPWIRVKDSVSRRLSAQEVFGPGTEYDCANAWETDAGLLTWTNVPAGVTAKGIGSIYTGITGKRLLATLDTPPIAISSSGSKWATIEGGKLCIWNARGGHAAFSVSGQPYTASLSPDGSFIVLVSIETRAEIVRCSTGVSWKLPLAGVTLPAAAPWWGHSLIVASSAPHKRDRMQISVLDADRRTISQASLPLLSAGWGEGRLVGVLSDGSILTGAIRARANLTPGAGRVTVPHGEPEIRLVDGRRGPMLTQFAFWRGYVVFLVGEDLYIEKVLPTHRLPIRLEQRAHKVRGLPGTRGGLR